MELEAQLQKDITTLAEAIGERHMLRPEQLEKAAEWIRDSFSQAGYVTGFQLFSVDGRAVKNVVATLEGTTKPEEIVIVGAHYDTVPGSPGADDNASGIAMMLAISRELAGRRFHRTIRFIGFVNEEWPHFQTETMGSLVYAKSCWETQENVVGMICLESVGYYSGEPGSQVIPPEIHVDSKAIRGDFVAMVSNKSSESLLSKLSGAFSAASNFPLMQFVLPESARGASWSDHWSFWKFGYQAVMVTDTAILRNPHYHEETDVPATLCLPALAAVTGGLVRAIEHLSDLTLEN